MWHSSACDNSFCRRAAWILTAVLVLATLPLPATTVDLVPGQRVVAIGDIHGNAAALQELLELTGVVDGTGHWAGGDTILVQVGDVLDRGPGARQAMDSLMALEKEAWDVGGMVIVLLGNHEAMNILGIEDYVDPGVYATFVDNESEQRREQGYERFKEYLVQRARHLGLQRPELNAEIESEW